jgi:hypothetical protein
VNSEQPTPVIEADVYTQIPAEKLVLYAVGQAQKQASPVFLEDLISVCFMLFPKTFGLKKYTQWPNSTLVQTLWSECHQNGLIEGELEQGFTLTEYGIQNADQTAIALGLKPAVKKRKTRKPTQQPLWQEPIPQPDPLPKAKNTRRAVKIEKVEVRSSVLAKKYIKVIERSDAYRSYRKNGKKNNISEFDFRSLLLCTMESSAETMAKNLTLYNEYAETLQRKDLMKFLDHCRNNFSYLFETGKKPRRKKVVK